MTIKETAHNYSEPRPVGTWWIITETDALTNVPTGAEFGYATKEGAWSAYFLLTNPQGGR